MIGSSNTKRALVLGTALFAASTMSLSAFAAPAPAAQDVAAAPSKAVSADDTYIVLAKEGVSQREAIKAIEAAGGQVTSSTSAIGAYSVKATEADFPTKVLASEALTGSTPNVVVGHAPKDVDHERFTVETDFEDEGSTGSTAVGHKEVDDKDDTGSTAVRHTEDHDVAINSVAEGAIHPDETYDTELWAMKMMHMDKVHAITQGEGVRVGIMDTGVEGNHPDIAPNFNRELSRNFTVDRPDIDGPCEEDPDGSCEDPNDADEAGHGTHVAGTVAAAVNGRGVYGVAPKAEIVNLRVGQDSGYFFLKPTVEALVYAGQNGVDVVNMSYYIDPWAFNCRNNPADSPEEQAAQATTIDATNRALRYARLMGVTLVSSAGNSHIDLDNPTVDDGSPNLPEGQERERQIDNSCLDMPVEGDGVLGVSAVGPNGLKADYSNWGSDAVALAAPGGYWRANFGTDDYKTPAKNLILSAYPKDKAIKVLRDREQYDEETGESSSRFILSDCPDGKDSCAYYRYLQGTSMASPQVAGGVALIIGKHGRVAADGQKSMSPYEAEMWLKAASKPQACPEEGFTYPEQDESFMPGSCEVIDGDSTWYGWGVLNPLRAVEAKGATRR